jgi:hypothetical protein
MTPTPDHIIDVTNAIQLALAPVFLLTGIAGMLNVMTGRLSRIIDRGRVISEACRNSATTEQDEFTHELHGLDRRRYFISVAITSCTIAALLLCLVVVSLFLEAILNAPFKWLVGACFASSTMALVIGLAFFLREVHMAMRTIHITSPETQHRGKK